MAHLLSSYTTITLIIIILLASTHANVAMQKTNAPSFSYRVIKMDSAQKRNSAISSKVYNERMSMCEE